MLILHVKSKELFNEETNEFTLSQPFTLKLEHSLISISKWETEYCKPFIGTVLTYNEKIFYIKCMSINTVDDDLYNYLSPEDILKIDKYIEREASATKISKSNDNNSSGSYVSSELIYYWMITYNIPFECEKWPFNRLLKLIEICAEKNKGDNKMSPEEILKRNHKLNEERKKQMRNKQHVKKG